jgi:hypothetical protein
VYIVVLALLFGCKLGSGLFLIVSGPAELGEGHVPELQSNPNRLLFVSLNFWNLAFLLLFFAVVRVSF